MSCSKCNFIPEFPSGIKDFYISASHEYILSKFTDIIKIKPITKTDYIYLSADAEEFFVDQDFSTLNSVEQKNINILILNPGESPGFQHFTQTKTLESWLIMLDFGELKWILEKGSITTLFHPILDAENLGILGYECLSRGVGKDGRHLSPVKMFDAAVNSGALFNLDRQCRETALKTAADKKIDGQVFINFIPTSIYNPEFCLQDTFKWTQQLDFNPENITFEVVETEKIENTEHLNNIIEHYREKGYMSALDDMGSGYSSLNLLAKLVPDFVKLDMEMVRGIDKNKTKQSIVEAVTSISRKLSFKVIAEGIETKEEYEWMKGNGVDYVQGYLFGKPSSEPLLACPSI